MFFRKKTLAENQPDGLSVRLEELVEQRKYLPYIKQRHIPATSDMAGDIRSAFKGRGMEFEEVRTYGFGDDVRDIDWRVTARKGDTYTKVFAEEKDREVYVVLDLSPYMLFGTKKELKSVSAAKLAALLGWQSLANKDRFGLILYDGKDTKVFKPQNNQKNLMAIFKAIAETSKEILNKFQEQPLSETDISDPLRFLEFNVKSRAVVFIISDFNDVNEPTKKTLVALTKRCRVYCINVYDVLEDAAPQNGEYFVQYSGDKLIFNTTSDIFKETYYRYFQQKRKVMDRFCKRFGCQYISIRTDRPLYKQLKILS